MDWQQQRALRSSNSSAVVAVAGVVGVAGVFGVVGVAEATLGLVGTGRALDHLEELVGELRDVFEPRAYLPCPSILLGAQLHRPCLNLTSMLYLAPWYAIVVGEVM